jgi:hypothetical protein
MNYSRVPNSVIEEIPSFSQMIHEAESMIPIPSSLMVDQMIHEADQMIHEAESMIPIPSSLMADQIIHSPVVDISNCDIVDKIEIFLTNIQEPLK